MRTLRDLGNVGLEQSMKLPPLTLCHFLNLREKCVQRTTVIASTAFHDSSNPRTHLLACPELLPIPQSLTNHLRL